ncbi:patatin-like phospholipase family protein [Bradyrhizobium sp. AUGA SZCCT0160]|uniref:patatin-like phospholipase family protein n=1 Tax=Bradyrhizobium sp. AUGA SZCCT0160 TaxID=2807662 RepID=UPI001BAB9D9A|nr:patatin-like phospholipase family protein [Bradyrhizobium sp. AUGA SZCCT0160]MBR1189109.1 patatin-like phospholipase family protein [Bradyrhizobium sp. AUGA SZCCT0160]
MDAASGRFSAATPEAGNAGDGPARSNQVRTINLALQGGGAHGAFTWGVLDRLLDEKDVAFEGLSATSAGAMNAAVFAYGLSVGGREGARKALTDYWKRVSDAASLGPLQPSPIDRLLGNHRLTWSPVFSLLGFVTRVLSPYEFNPSDYNPLREVVEQSIDFEVLKRADCPVKLFLSATNVRTGKVKIFSGAEISASAVMASACVPTMFHAVEIDGEAYWDGGYMGNPALFPLIYNCKSSDIVIVHINPLFRKELPHAAVDILNRINEISFNSSLMREMRAVSFITRLVKQNHIVGGDVRQIFIHSVADDEFMGALSPTSKYNADWDFLVFLRDQGRKCANDWLTSHFVKLGVESSVNIDEVYL